MNLWGLRSEEAGKACAWDAEGVTPPARGSFTLDLFLWMAPREELGQTDRQTRWFAVPHRTRSDETSCQPDRLGEIHNRQLAARRRDG